MSGSRELFDRKRYRIRRSRRGVGPGFLHDELRHRLLDRLNDIKRQFGDVLLIGGDDATLAAALRTHPSIGRLVWLNDTPNDGVDLLGDPELVPFAHPHFDAVIGAMGLHVANDVPGVLVQTRRALKPDGLLLWGFPGGESLRELRYCLMQAELEVSGGAAMRLHPMIDIRDAGALLMRAGLALPVADSERIDVRYRKITRLLDDLRSMGESQVLRGGSNYLPMPVLSRAASIYEQEFKDEEGLTSATFDLIFMTGWNPDDNQPQALKPGSAKARLIDALKPPDS